MREIHEIISSNEETPLVHAVFNWIRNTTRFAHKDAKDGEMLCEISLKWESKEEENAEIDN